MGSLEWELTRKWIISWKTLRLPQRTALTILYLIVSFGPKSIFDESHFDNVLYVRLHCFYFSVISTNLNWNRRLKTKTNFLSEKFSGHWSSKWKWKSKDFLGTLHKTIMTNYFYIFYHSQLRIIPPLCIVRHRNLSSQSKCHCDTRSCVYVARSCNPRQMNENRNI